jgi:Ca2+-binding RTX toxin-like protein
MSIVLTDLQTGESVTVTNLKATSGAPETGGNDILNGGGGSDFLFGQAGDDTFCISNARDAFGDRINGGSGLDTVKNATSALVLTDFRTTSALDTQTVAGVEIFDGNGKEILGRDAAFDGVGNDVDLLDFTGMTFVNVTRINGRSGNDQIIGSDSDDMIYGGAGDDWLAGGSGDDDIYGEVGLDQLVGDEGADLLNGGAGSDLLEGGPDADLFVCLVADANNNPDTVVDFVQTADQIGVNTSVYGRPLPLAVVPGTGPSGTGAASQIRYASGTPTTTIYLPGTGASAFRQILIVGPFTLTGADFQQN